MIQIQQDVWRPDCIASVGLYKHQKLIQILPTGSSKFKTYIYSTPEDASYAYDILFKYWIKSMEGGAA